MVKKPTGGIYVISVTGVGNYYGESNNIERRWQRHRKQLNNQRHANYRLKAAWKSLGPKHFTFTVLECNEALTVSKELRLYRELLYINNDPHCLNIKDNRAVEVVTSTSLPNRPIYRNRTVILQRKAKGSRLVRIMDDKRNLLGVEAVVGQFRMGTFKSDVNCKLSKVNK